MPELFKLRLNLLYTGSDYMKKAICLSVIIFNILFISGAILCEKYIFMGVYKTALFWGVSLYALTATTIMLINTREFPVFMWINVLLTFIAIVWFFIYMPKFKPAEALSEIKKDSKLASYELISDPVTPVEKANVSGFIKGSYRFIDKNNPEIAFVFNPVTGSYYRAFSENTDIILPSKTITEIDKAFEEEYNLIPDSDSYAKILLVVKYKNIWMENLNKTYNELLYIINDDSKELLIKDQNEWTENLNNANLLSESILSERYKSDINLNMFELENSMYHIRTRAIKLKRIYERIN